MKKTIYRIATIMMAVLPLISCSLAACRKDSKSTAVKEYKPDVQWKLDTYAPPYNSYSTQSGRWFYFTEVYQNSDGKCCYGICKVDLETGTKVWSSDPFGLEDSYKELIRYPLVGDGLVFLQNGDGTIIYCFDDSDGRYLAKVGVGKGDSSKTKYNTICNGTLHVADGRYLVWSNSNRTYEEYGDSDYEMYKDADFGLLKMRISDIDLGAGTDSVQYPEVETLLKFPFVSDESDSKRIATHLISEGTTVYYQTLYSDVFHKSCFGAIDVETGILEWEHESEDMKGTGLEALYILNDPDEGLTDRLYSFEHYAGCYDLKTGDPYWEKVQHKEDLLSEPYVAGLVFSCGVTYSDGRFYYTTSEYDNGHSDSSIDSNIKCVDARTGEYVWGYLPEGTAALMTRPIVSGGKVFVTTEETGLYVFNAKTGKLIGVDSSVVTGPAEKNACWNGNVIYFNFANGYGTLYSIKP